MTAAFLHNWASRVDVETAYRTHHTAAEDSLAEERCGDLARPVRALRFRWDAVNRGEAQRMLLELQRAGTDGLDLPLYCDQAVTTATSSGTTINCPTADRRFAVNKQVVIFELSGGRPTNVQTPTVSVVGAASLTLSGALTGSYAAGALVFPLVASQPVLSPRLRYHANDAMSIDLLVDEPLEEALPALVSVGSNPAGFDLQGQWPIFDVEPDWADGVELGLDMKASVYMQGRSQVVQTHGPRPRVTIAADLLFRTRAEAFAVLRFFESRGGSLSPFYLACPAAVWTPVTLDTGFVDVSEPTGALVADAEDLYSYVGVVMNDGTHYVRPISSITDTGSAWRITLSSSLPVLSLANVRRITPAFFVRFAQDVLRESWLTDVACRIPLHVVEVLGEGSDALP